MRVSKIFGDVILRFFFYIHSAIAVQNIFYDVRILLGLQMHGDRIMINICVFKTDFVYVIIIKQPIPKTIFLLNVHILHSLLMRMRKIVVIVTSVFQF